MKKKLTSKKCIAVFLAAIIAITSIPFMMVGAEDSTDKYDPAPYFSDEAIKQGADAWLDEEGNVQVIYPAATPIKTFKGEETTIAFYILELVNMGEKNKVHEKTVIDTIKVSGTEATFKAADIGKIDFENNRYSVTITAVDSENWFSQSIYTTVSRIPKFEYNVERYKVFTSNTSASREMMTFETNDTTTDGTVITGNALQFRKVVAEREQNGVENADGTDSKAIRLIVEQAPTGTQTFDTNLSRQTWDYVGADEVWFWMDLSRVEIEGLSFRLRAQEKEIIGWASGKTGDMTTNGDKMGSIVYSTKGTAASTYTGEAPYVYTQREDGGWDKVMLNEDGTIDLANFKGYIRIPIEFMCSETDAVVTAKNTGFETDKTDIIVSTGHGFPQIPNDEQTAAATASTRANAENYVNSTLKIASSYVIDAAGTPISDALLLQKRLFKFANYKYWVGNQGNSQLEVGIMPAIQKTIDGKNPYATTDSKRAVFNEATGKYTINDNTYRAIEDIYSAGFSFDNMSADSLCQSFFMDNVIFYREDGQKWTDLALDGYDANTGEQLVDYYDQETEVAKAIFDAIDKYIDSPDWADYREVEHILDMIDGYKTAFANKGESTAFLEFGALDAKAKELGRNSWQRALDAYSACIQGGTIVIEKDEKGNDKIVVKANSDKYDLVPQIINTLEKMPKAGNITFVSELLKAEILKLWQAYSLLNLGQLEMLGKEEEAELLALFTLISEITENDGEEFLVGQQLADFPYILFNDFEKNTTVGERSWQAEDDVNSYSTGTMIQSWRHTKSFVTYSAKNGNDVTDRDKLNYNSGGQTESGLDSKVLFNAASGKITENGFYNSKAATVNIDANYTGSVTDGSGVSGAINGKEAKGAYHTVTVSKNSVSNPDHAQFANNNMRAENLGGLAQAFTGTDGIHVPLSLVFYVDFSELSNFYFVTNIYTKDANNNDVKARVNMGKEQIDMKYFILDPDTGNWVINHSDSPWCFTSTKQSNDTVNDKLGLDGYKGYISIPLYHFKVPGTVLENKLDESEAQLNNIFAVQIAVGGLDVDEKSFTIDNIGFTYDPDPNIYSASSSRNDSSYAKLFGAKSIPAAEFEAAVDAIDIRDKNTRETAVSKAEELYANLHPDQKTEIQSVKDAYETLQDYRRILNGEITLEDPVYTPAELNEILADETLVPIAAKNSSVTGEFELIMPGFENGEVKYDAYGLTPELADSIISYYEESYARYSNAEKAQVDSTSLLNAYRAAMRTGDTLESIKTDAVEFLPGITGLYTVKYDYNDDGELDNKDENIANETSKIGNFLSIADRNSVETFYESEYCPLQYYSKTSIDDGSIYPQLQNTSRGFTYFLKNTEEYDIDGDGTSDVEGGILTLKNEMQELYDYAQPKLEAKQLLDNAKLQQIKDVINEYNALLPAYYNVEELYELAQKLIRLFPCFDVTMGTTDLILSPDSVSQQTTYSVNYAEVLDLETETTQMYIRLSTKSEDGTMSDALGNKISYKLKMGEYEVDASQINDLPDANWLATYPVLNNTYTQGNGASFEITASVTSEQISSASLSGVASDDVILEVLTSSGTLVDTKTIKVSYSENATYEITFPAAVTIPFGETNSVTSGDIAITHNMPSTKKLTISLTETGGTMVIDTTKLPTGVTVPDPLPTIAYTANFANKTVVGTGTTGTDKTNFTVQVTEDQWNQAYVNDYIDSGLTFMVSYKDVT